MKLKRFFKEQKGVLVSDAMISILIILIFSTLILSLIVNVTTEMIRVKINSQQVDYIVEVLEYAKKIPYEQVTTENLIAYVNGKNSETVSAGTDENLLTTRYKMIISVEKYGENEGKIDLIKRINVRVVSQLLEKNITTEMTKIKKATSEEIEIILENL